MTTMDMMGDIMIATMTVMTDMTGMIGIARMNTRVICLALAGRMNPVKEIATNNSARAISGRMW